MYVNVHTHSEPHTHNLLSLVYRHLSSCLANTPSLQIHTLKDSHTHATGGPRNCNLYTYIYIHTETFIFDLCIYECAPNSNTHTHMQQVDAGLAPSQGCRRFSSRFHLSQFDKAGEKLPKYSQKSQQNIQKKRQTNYM